MAQDLGAGQLAGIQVLPVGEQLAGAVFLPRLQRITDGREVVAELPEAQGEVEHRHIEDQGQHGAVAVDEDVRQRQQGRRGQHRDHPNHAGVHIGPSVEIAPGPTHPGRQRVVDGVEVGQGLELLRQQGEEHGKKAHALMIAAVLPAHASVCSGRLMRRGSGINFATSRRSRPR